MVPDAGNVLVTCGVEPSSKAPSLSVSHATAVIWPSGSSDVEVSVTGSRGFGESGPYMNVARGRVFATGTMRVATALAPELSVTFTLTV